MNGHICIAVLAHVDAGKTTLSEAMLFLSGAIRRLGRVDARNAFLDTDELERARGITIYSKQAEFALGDYQITLLDTPGHVDFSAEMERALQVLDYAVLVVSGADGVQSHTRTLWKLLRRYEIPVFLFVNKMDQPGTDRAALMEELKRELDGGCVDFGGGDPAFLENVAVCEEQALERYLESGALSEEEIARLIRERKVFPCWFGSALKVDGVEDFLVGMERYMRCPAWGDAFGARVFKVSRDSQGSRLSWLRVTGGTLRVKDMLPGGKVNQIRVYSGEKYETRSEAEAGSVCAVTGLDETRPGEGLGADEGTHLPILEPVLTYRVLPPRGCDPLQLYGKLRQLEEEEPELHIRWDEELREIQAQLMGEVQIEILKARILERFDLSVDFDEGNIVYKETIRNTVEGVGHFEPLRHYAEVHLLLEPGEPGSGLSFSSSCSEDELALNWQRLILTHLQEKTHRGVLTGSEITDLHVTLAAGRAHLKHTEGGDFRQATYRALRQGLMQAESVLLEPWYEFRLELPTDSVGRAMSDLERMGAEQEPPDQEGGMAVLRGSVPVAAIRNYQRELSAYTRGQGHLSCALKGYAPCHNAEEVVARCAYDPDADTENPSSSVFCYHGAGTVIPWYEVPEHMHLESVLKRDRGEEGSGPLLTPPRRERKAADSAREEKELEEIFTRTYGAPKERSGGSVSRRSYGNESGRAADRSASGKEKPDKPYVYRPKPALPEYLLVDGYNVIFAWEELDDLAKTSIAGAREKLQDILCNYQGYRQCQVILVFDAYRVEGHKEEILHYHNIDVVYTREAETADSYIERTAHQIGRKYRVTVATSDGLEQIIIRGQGCATMSSRELKEEIERMNREIRETYVERFSKSNNYLFDDLPDTLAAARSGTSGTENPCT
ncbi:MAG: TetM/TetW/TetO/TetS family tetracycline resistance ribosomal protection protein [Lachnospiraceae bacterium]|nr:TetM/TetW/TetO/TetS family tetracycline resistance ribosomal protection protein [Lachnospiraceae bacterium]